MIKKRFSQLEIGDVLTLTKSGRHGVLVSSHEPGTPHSHVGEKDFRYIEAGEIAQVNDVRRSPATGLVTSILVSASSGVVGWIPIYYAGSFSVSSKSEKKEKVHIPGVREVLATKFWSFEEKRVFKALVELCKRDGGEKKFYKSSAIVEFCKPGGASIRFEKDVMMSMYMLGVHGKVSLREIIRTEADGTSSIVDVEACLI